MVCSGYDAGWKASQGEVMYYIHKHEVAQSYGGPEEGGWWYEVGTPVETSEWNPSEHKFGNEDAAYAQCRILNQQERERAAAEEDYEYTSVLSYKSNHYAYSVSNYPVATPYPERRPHYE